MPGLSCAGSNPAPLYWEHSLSPCTTREAPVRCLLSTHRVQGAGCGVFSRGATLTRCRYRSMRCLVVERRCPGRSEAGELHPAPPGSQKHPHLSPLRVPRTGLWLHVPCAEHTAGGPQVCAEGGCWGEQMRVTVEGPVRWAEESVGRWQSSSECEEIPGEEAGLSARRPKGDGQGLRMAAPSLGMPAEGSASRGSRASPIPSSPGDCGCACARRAEVSSCNSMAWTLRSVFTCPFTGGSDGRVSACSAGDPGSIPGSGRCSGEGNGNPLQCSCLENPRDGGAWWATVHGVAKSWAQLSDFT